jgi:hypothetical protein
MANYLVFQVIKLHEETKTGADESDKYVARMAIT